MKANYRWWKRSINRAVSPLGHKAVFPILKTHLRDVFNFKKVFKIILIAFWFIHTGSHFLGFSRRTWVKICFIVKKAGVLQDLEVAKSHSLQEDLQSQPHGWHLPTIQKGKQYQHSPLAKSPVARNPAERCSAQSLQTQPEVTVRTQLLKGGTGWWHLQFPSHGVLPLIYFRWITSAEFSITENESFKVLLIPPGKLWKTS